MNKNKILKALIGAAILVVLIVQLQNKNIDVGTPEKQEVKVGVIGILSGPFASFGESYLNGVKLAEEEWEKTHVGIDVKLVVEDDGFEAKKGVTAYKKLTSIDNVAALLNTSTPSIDAIHEDIIDANLPTVQFGIQNTQVAKDPIFQLSPAPDAILKSFGEYADKNLTVKKLAAVHTNGEPFNTFYSAFDKSYNGTTVEKTISGESDIAAIATDIARGDYDGVVIMTMPKDGALLVKKIQSLTKRPITYLIDAQLQTGQEDYKRILGDMKVLDGTYTQWILSGDQTQFKKDYLAKYGTEPGAGADYGYDAFNTLMNAYDKDKSVWIKNLQKTNTAGVSGAIAFDEVGQRVQGLQVMRIVDGEIKPIE